MQNPVYCRRCRLDTPSPAPNCAPFLMTSTMVIKKKKNLAKKKIYIYKGMKPAAYFWRSTKNKVSPLLQNHASSSLLLCVSHWGSRRSLVILIMSFKNKLLFRLRWSNLQRREGVEGKLGLVLVHEEALEVRLVIWVGGGKLEGGKFILTSALSDTEAVRFNMPERNWGPPSIRRVSVTGGSAVKRRKHQATEFNVSAPGCDLLVQNGR